MTQLAARLNKAEREATFLRQSRASPASAGGSGRDAKLEASHRNLEREYDLLRRKLNAALDRASKQLDADVSDAGDARDWRRNVASRSALFNRAASCVNFASFWPRISFP